MCLFELCLCPTAAAMKYSRLAFLITCLNASYSLKCFPYIYLHQVACRCHCQAASMSHEIQCPLLPIEALVMSRRTIQIALGSWRSLQAMCMFFWESVVGLFPKFCIVGESILHYGCEYHNIKSARYDVNGSDGFPDILLVTH